jgi:hypothetical protein
MWGSDWQNSDPTGVFGCAVAVLWLCCTSTASRFPNASLETAIYLEPTSRLGKCCLDQVHEATNPEVPRNWTVKRTAQPAAKSTRQTASVVPEDQPARSTAYKRQSIRSSCGNIITPISSFARLGAGSKLNMPLNERETAQLKAALQEAVAKCSERCLYQSAKWYKAYYELEYTS